MWNAVHALSSYVISKALINFSSTLPYESIYHSARQNLITNASAYSKLYCLYFGYCHETKFVLLIYFRCIYYFVQEMHWGRIFSAYVDLLNK